MKDCTGAKMIAKKQIALCADHAGRHPADTQGTFTDLHMELIELTTRFDKKPLEDTLKKLELFNTRLPKTTSKPFRDNMKKAIALVVYAINECKI